MSWPSESRRSTEPPPSSLLGLVAREFLAQTVRARLGDYANNRVGWVRDCIEWAEGEGPTNYQNEVLGRFDAGERRVAVRGPHSLGKTSLAAWLMLHFALTREQLGYDWKAATTASVWRQLSLYLWPEIHKWAKRLRWDRVGRTGPFNERTELLDLILKLEHGQAFAVASDRPEAIEGAHADQLLYIFDEAKAIPPATWDAAEGALAGGNCYALAISTPGEPQGRFYEIHARRPGFGDWSVRHVTKEEVIRERPDSGFEQWAADRAKQWPEGSALYQNRVLGEFASSEADGMIPLGWIEAANRRWEERKDSGGWGEFTCVGVDVGAGGDQTVFALRHGEAVRELRRFGIADTMVTTGNVVAVLRGHGGYSVVDVIGVGAGVVHRLREQGYTVEPFGAGETTEWKDRSGELRFVNKRAAAWWNLRELLDPANGHSIALPPDDLLTGDLTAPHYRQSSGGRILVESKEDIRKRLGRSTDSGDAVVQSFWQDRAPAYPPPQIGRVSYSGRNMSGRRKPLRINDGRRIVIIK